MTLLDTINIGGLNYGLNSKVPMGTCATPAGSEVKECLFADNFQLSAGNLIAVTFTYANTYGDGSVTYPKLSVQGTQYPVKYCTGEYASNGAWVNGEAVTFMFDGTNFIRTLLPVTDTVEANNMHAVTSNAVADYIGSMEFITDANSAIPPNDKEKVYYIYANKTNIPDANYNWVIVSTNGRSEDTPDNRRLVQMAYATGGQEYGAVYTRLAFSSDGGTTWTWRNWDKVITNSMLATSIASGGTTPPTSGAVYDNLITLLRTNNFRVFALGGDGTQTGLEITYSGSRQYSAIGFLIISRYSIEFIHIELNELSNFFARKDNIIAKRSSRNVTISNTDNTITVSDGSTWNSWTILMFTANGDIFENISFRAVA